MYATLADLLEQMDEEVLIQLTDDAKTGTVDSTVIDRAVANAQAVIDAHCGGRYSVPFNPVPDLIRMFAVDLSAYNLYSRRPNIETPEVIGERQKQALAHLRLVQKGEASVGIPVAVTSGTTESHGAMVSGNERLFNRKNMRGL